MTPRAFTEFLVWTLPQTRGAIKDFGKHTARKCLTMLLKKSEKERERVKRGAWESKRGRERAREGVRE